MFKTKQTGFLCFDSPCLCPSPQGWNVFHSLHSLNCFCLNSNWMCLSVKGARGVRFNFYHFSIYLEFHLRDLSPRDTSPGDTKAHPASSRARTSFSGSAQVCLVCLTWKIQPGTIGLRGALHSLENLNIGTDTLCLYRGNEINAEFASRKRPLDSGDDFSLKWADRVKRHTLS